MNWNFFKRCHLAGSLLIADRGNKQLHRFLQGVAFLHPLHEELVYPVYLADYLVNRRLYEYPWYPELGANFTVGVKANF